MLQQYEKMKSVLSSAKKIVFFTGAGISAESGIPTFRGKEGIWNKMKPEELANFNAFLRNPDIVWFGEYLSEAAYSLSEVAAENCDVMFIIGTSAVFFPAANIPYIAKKTENF